MESKGGRHSSIVLCTNGILLRVLISDGLGKLSMEGPGKSRKNVVSDLTHIIVVCILFLAFEICHFLSRVWFLFFEFVGFAARCFGVSRKIILYSFLIKYFTASITSKGKEGKKSTFFYLEEDTKGPPLI